MSDDEKDETRRAGEDDLLEAQTGKGYGADEGERDTAPPEGDSTDED